MKKIIKKNKNFKLYLMMFIFINRSKKYLYKNRNYIKNQ